MKKIVGYLRVSSQEQGRSGLGLESQEAAIRSFATRTGGELVKVFTEIESGKINNRPVLCEALRFAELIGGELVIHRLDRLSRDLNFITTLQKANVEFRVVDMPEADKFTIQLFGCLAEKERTLISERTKGALAAARARGVKLGTPRNLTAAGRTKGAATRAAGLVASADIFAAKVKPMIDEMREQGLSLRGVAAQMNKSGVLTARGKTGAWTATAIKNVLRR